MTDQPLISLLHATYRAGAEAVRIRDAWFESAERPESIEHIFGYDADDEVSCSDSRIVGAGVRGPPIAPRVSAVRNWNAAAAVARGGLLVVIADDLMPPPRWDLRIRQIVGCLDVETEAFVLKVSDGENEAVGTIRHPVVSREYYRRFGLWDSHYDGYGVDNEFTMMAHLRGVVIDAREIVMSHRHPTSGHEPSESHAKMRDSGRGTYERRVPQWQRHYRRAYLKHSQDSKELSLSSVIRCALEARLGYAWGIVPARLKAIARRFRRA